MSITLYPAFAERTTDGFAVHFPDLPVGGAGDTLEAAYSSAVEGAAIYAASMVRDGEAMPAPTPMAHARPEEGCDAVASFMVPVETSGRAIRLNVTMDEGLVAAIDKVADNRSRFLAEAARERLASLAG